MSYEQEKPIRVVPVPVKSSGLAIVLSFFYPGLGQLYAGRIARGLFIMIVSPFVLLIGAIVLFSLSGIPIIFRDRPLGIVLEWISFFGFLILVAFILWIWVMVDAKNLCDEYNRRATDLERIQQRKVSNDLTSHMPYSPSSSHRKSLKEQAEEIRKTYRKS